MFSRTVACTAAIFDVEPHAQVLRSLLCLQERLQSVEGMVLGWFVILGFVLGSLGLRLVVRAVCAPV